MKVTAFILALLCFATNGCAPVRMTVGKHNYGDVIDKGTGKPIAGAQVMYRHNSPTAVITGENGEFSLGRTNVWFMTPLLPVDYFGYPDFPIEAKADGYKSQVIRPHWRDDDALHFELTPKKKKK